MIRVIYSPQWFYGKDIVIDLVSVFVLLLIAFFSFKYYKIRKNKNYVYFGLSFILLSVSFLFKILTNFTIYFHVLETKNIGFLTLTYQTIKTSDVLFIVGFLIYRLLTLFGLYMLYSVYYDQPKTNILLIAYLILVSTYFTQSAYYIFHLTSLILLVLLTIQYSKTYIKNKNNATRMLASSFGIITASQILSIFVSISTKFYVVAEIIQLIGYVILLFSFLTVLRHGKKKNKD